MFYGLRGLFICQGKKYGQNTSKQDNKIITVKNKEAIAPRFPHDGFLINSDETEEVTCKCIRGS